MLRVSIGMDIHDFQERNFQKTFKEHKMKPKMSDSSSGSGSSAAWLKELKTKQKVFFPAAASENKNEYCDIFHIFLLLTRHSVERQRRPPISCYLAHPRKRFLCKRRFFFLFILLHQN